MTTPPRTHRDVILLLGGPTAVARDLGLEPVNTTVHWPTRGVPKGYRQRLSEKLAALDVHLSWTDWEALPTTVQTNAVHADAQAAA